MKKIIMVAIFFSGVVQFAAAQRMVKNIDPKKSNRNIREIVKTSQYVLFTANDSAHGQELWRTSGTAASTVMIKDINPGVAGAWGKFSQYNLLAIGDKVFFNADNGTDGEELWVTDGTTANTVMLKDINPGNGWGQPRFFHNYKDTLYFSAYENVNGFELWKSDGTAAGTVMVKKISTKTGASNASNPRGFTIYKNELYFVANDRVSGDQIWKTNGSEAGTVQVSNYNSPTGLFPNDMFVAGDLIYFRANNGSGDLELWKCDGTEAGTVLVKDINPTGSSQPGFFGALNGKVFFRADDGTNGQELWTSDGTDTGTLLLKDFSAGTASGLSSHFGFTNYKNELYFTARGTGEQDQIWKTSGSVAGTVKAIDLSVNSNKSPNSYIVFGKTLYFRAVYGADGVNAVEMFKTDGTTAGTSLVKNINLQANGSANIYYLTEFEGNIYFSANDTANGDELWVLDNAISFGSNVVKTECDSLILGNTTYKSNGTFLHYLNNSKGYDSLITLNLTIIEKPSISKNGDLLVASTLALSYKWFLNGNNINGAVSQSYKPTQNGLYAVETNTSVSGGGGCTKTSSNYNLSNVGIGKLEKLGHNIYPNPAKNMIQINSVEAIEMLIIYSLDGKQLMQTNLSTVDVSKLSPGVYIVFVTTASGNSASKLLIEK